MSNRIEKNLINNSKDRKSPVASQLENNIQNRKNTNTALFYDEMQMEPEGEILPEDEKTYLEDMHYLYWKSYSELELVFKNKFLKSDTFKKMIISLNENMIEYRFMRQAGLLKDEE